MENDYTKHLTIRDVRGMGRGVFTTVDIKKGETIHVAPAIVLSPGDMSHAQDTILAYYTFDCEDIFGHALIALGYGSLFNHDNEPNVDFEGSFYDKTVTFTAERDIEAGEQLFIDYAWDWDELYGEDDDD